MRIKTINQQKQNCVKTSRAEMYNIMKNVKIGKEI